MALSEILARVSLDDSGFRKGINRLKAQTSVFGEIGQSLSAAITLPLSGIALFSGNAFKEFDSLRRGLEVMTGSAIATASRLKELREIAKQPGLSFQEAIQGDVRLRAVGVSAQQSARILREFGNAIATTGGGGEELGRVTVQLGQLIAKGKVYAQDLKPIIEAAPAVGRALSQIYGTVDSEQIQKILESSGKSSTDFINGLLDKLNEAPRVTGGFKNSLENLKDSLFVLGASLGEGANKAFNLDGRISSLSDKISGLADRFQTLNPAVQKFVLYTGGISAALGPALILISKLTPAIISLVKAKDVLAVSTKNLIGYFRLLGGGSLIGFINFISSKVPIAAAAMVALTSVTRNFNSIATSVGKVGAYFIDLYNSIKPIKDLLDAVSRGTAILFNVLVASVESAVSLIAAKVSTIGQVIKAGIKGDFSLASALIKTASINDGVIIDKYLDKLAIALNDGIKSKVGGLNVNIPTGGRRNFGKKEDTNAVSTPNLGNVNLKTDEVGDANKRLGLELSKIDGLLKIYGSGFDAVSEKIEAYRRVIDELAGNSAPRAQYAINLAYTELVKLLNQGTVNVTPIDAFASKIDGISVKLQSLEAGATFNKLGQDILKIQTPLEIISKEFENIDRLAEGLGSGFDKVGEKMKVLEGLFRSGAISTRDYNTGLSGLGETKNKLTSHFEELANAIGQNLARVDVQVASNAEVQASLASLNAEMQKNLDIVRDPTATEAQQKAAYAQIELLKKQMQVEKDKADVVKSTGKAIYNSIRETIKAYYAETIASVLAKSAKLGPIAGVLLGGVAAATFTGLFNALVPKLAKGGLAFGPTLALVGDNKNAKNDPEVISPLSRLKALLDDGNGRSTEIYSKLAGIDLMLSNKYSLSYYERIT
jgi:tape measure domain-containing protein